MANFDVNVVVNVSTETPPAGLASFTVPLFAGVPLSTFSDRVRFYESPADVEADDDLSYPCRQALSAAFGQSPSVARVGLGRIDPTDPMSVDWTMSGGAAAIGDTFTVSYNGVETSVTAAAADPPATVAGALRAALTAALVTYPVTVSGAGAHVILTGTGDYDSFLFGTEVVGAGTVVFGTPAVDYNFPTLSTALDAILAADDSWYGLALQSRDADDLEAAGEWAETSKRLFIGQTSDAACKTGGPGDPFTAMKALSLAQSAGIWHADDAEFADTAWLGKTLAADPDTVTTIWAYKRLSLVTSDRDYLSTSEKGIILGNNGNVYLPFKSTPVTGMGRTFSGQPLDLTVTMNWLEARVQEAVVALLISESNLNRKVPYTDAGVAHIQSAVEAVGLKGERVGHFTPGSFVVTAPLVKDVDPAKKAARELDLSFQCEAAGAIEKVTINGYVMISL